MKTILLIATISLGILFPVTHSFAYIIKYLLMIMLFFSFLKMEVKKENIDKSHFYILFFNIVVPIISFFIIKNFNLTLAKVAFVTAIAPTAIASPIIINLLNKKIEYAVISILLTNFTVAFLLPFLIPSLLNGDAGISFMDVMYPVATIFTIPFFLSLLIKKFSPFLKERLVKLNKYMFYILVININLGTAKASNYIREEMSFTDPLIYQIALLSFFFCLLYFNLGRRISPKRYRTEGGQSLGQKNNGFTLWVALTFISPLAVLGPVFYILCQNTYISWQLHRNKE